MKRLVVNADDFGLTESINRGIMEAHRRGIVTSTTLLANGAAFDSAVALARSAGTLGVGVHLNLTHGRPVCDPASIPSLLDDQGHLCASPAGLARRIFFGSLRLAHVEQEWAAQIEKVRQAGVSVTHLDGHKHVHMLPAVFPIAVRLARHYHIGGVRLAVERPMGLGTLLGRNAVSATRIIKQYLGGRALALAALDFRHQLEAAGLASPMYFHGITRTGFLDAPALDSLLWNLPEGTSELMCHPGYADSALRRSGTRLVAERERELAALTRRETRNLVTRLGIELIDYRALTASA